MENQPDAEQIPMRIRGVFQNGQALATAIIQEHLDREKNVLLNIAVTGKTGSGKSTFVNAIRGVGDEDKGAAPTDVVESTEEVTRYPHPNFPNVVLWDLPGVGTPNYPAADYMRLVGFERFDFFIIISSERFTENDMKLAKEIQRMKKMFYFVRSKIDIDIENQKRKKDFNKESTLKRVGEYCTKRLLDQGFESPLVFLVSSFDLHLYDFLLLVQTLERELPELKREAFLLAMPNTSLEMIDRKKKAFKAKIKYYAALSALIAAVPVPGLSASVDVNLMVKVINEYKIGFGLDIPSMQRLADRKGVRIQDLMVGMTSPLTTREVTYDVVFKVIVQCVNMAAPMVAEEGSRYIPLLGIPAAMALSFTTTYYGLSSNLNMLAEDAQKVFRRALDLTT
ncbi:interferon-inducible GTPase 5-like [Halichoeres trimaculatus]|uniref:interferon-inducible GTPase 5-like n=1 Tax=Halichoeres trimaculatus TaxID=147232 RepID=UPI003D9E3B58